MQDLGWLQQTLASWYGLQVSSAQKVRDAWRVETPSGSKCFKQVKSSPAKVKFTAAAVQYVLNNGFKQTVPLLKTLEGAQVIQLPEGVFYATDWLPGREGDFSRLEDIQAAAQALARFHQASRGFVPPEDCEQKETWGTLPEQWLKHYRQLEEFRLLAELQPEDRFSQLYLSCFASYLLRAQQAIDFLNNCNYDALVELAKKQGSLCHRDYTYHNVLVDDSIMYIIDFDYCTQEIRVYDIGKFIRRVAKYHHYKLTPVKLLLNAYHTESKLHNNELMFILAFVYFPQRFWRIANRFHRASQVQVREHLIAQLEQEKSEMTLEENFLLQLSAEVSGGDLLRR